MLLLVFLQQILIWFSCVTLWTHKTVETLIVSIAVLPFLVVRHVIFVHCLVFTRIAFQKCYCVDNMFLGIMVFKSLLRFSILHCSSHMLHFNFSPCFSFICFTIPLRAYLFPHWPHSSFCCSPTLSSPLLSCDVTLSLTLMYYLMYLYLAIVMIRSQVILAVSERCFCWEINMSNINWSLIQDFL